MLRYLDRILIPYIVKFRADLNLADDQTALAVFDVFAAHRCRSLLDKLDENHIKYVRLNLTTID